MRIRIAGIVQLVVAPLLLLATGCAKAASTKSPTPFPAATAAATATATAAVTPAVSATAAAGATPTEAAGPANGSTIQVGNVNVVSDRFRAQVTDPAGVNIRSSPQVTPDNRTGSLAPGAIVEVEGRVLQGQEAEPGNGTLWYYVGTAGSTPQFVYGAPGTLTPLTGSATPAVAASATVAPTPLTASPTPSP